MKLCKIVNTTKGTILAEQAEIADNLFTRLKGLLGRDSLARGKGLVIIPCSSIHTFFMRFKIDVLFLNKEGRVVAKAVSLPANRLFGASLKGMMVIELPVGTIERARTEKGDLVEMEDRK